MARNILDRLERLIDEAVRSRRFPSTAAVLRSAGVTTGYLSEFRKRIGKDPKADMTSQTIARFARALGVSAAEITGGEDEPEPPLVDKYSERAWSITAARALKLPEAAIQVVLAEDPGGTPSRMYWFRRIETEAERLKPSAESGSFKI